MRQSFVPMEGKRPVLVAGVRTAFQKAGTGFQGLSPADLGVAVLQEAMARAEVRPDEVDEIILGCCGQSSKEANIARVLSLRAGLPNETPAYTVHRNCASGLQSIEEAARRIVSGEGEIYLVGGTEAMSDYPLIFNEGFKSFLATLSRSKTLGARLRQILRFKLGYLKPRIALLEGLTDPTCGLIMGLTAEKLADEFGISRNDQDLFALASHQKAIDAWAAGLLDDEVLTLWPGKAKKAVHQDNGPRDGQSLDALARLRPFFDRREGSVTVGNACPVTDGSVALLIMNEELAKARGLEPLGRMICSTTVGLEPSRMGLGPAIAAPKAIHDAGLSMQDMEVWEINEAFSAQVLACLEAMDSAEFGRERLGLSGAFGAPDMDKVNPRGGAVAMGHPVGATGSRLVLSLLRQLQAQGGGMGVATLCVGGGQGSAQIWEAA
jgi:acetyl-CoA acetyltransferase family protein